MKICILGNGLSSLTLAKNLINQGVKVDIFSDSLKNYYYKSQTIGISKSNVDYFNNNIININKLLWKIKNIEIYSQNLENEKILNFKLDDQELFSIIKNFDLYNFLLSDLKKSKLFNFKKLKKNIADYRKYNLIINSDKNHSFTKKFFYKKIIKDYNSRAYITLIKHKKILNNTAVQFFTKNGPLAFLPSSSTETSVVYSMRGKRNFKQSDYIDLINKYSSNYKIKEIKIFNDFDLKSSNLRNYYHRNILAFGDLLHRLHPLAGQGFNMVLRDVKVLTDLIDYKISLGIDLDKSVCSEFEKKIKSQNYLFSSGVDFIYEFFNIESKIQSKFLSKSLQILGKNKSVNKLFIKFADNGINI